MLRHLLINICSSFVKGLAGFSAYPPFAQTKPGATIKTVNIAH
jgi:hypothetical protein